jgi:hypothetical protein
MKHVRQPLILCNYTDTDVQFFESRYGLKEQDADRITKEALKRFKEIILFALKRGCSIEHAEIRIQEAEVVLEMRETNNKFKFDTRIYIDGAPTYNMTFYE